MTKKISIIDQDDVNESLLMHDIARLTKKYFDRRARCLDLTRAQWLALSTLNRNPGINQVDLAERLEVEPMTIARLVDRLEEAGWVERRACAEDRRSKTLHLTARAQGVIGKIRAISVKTREEALAGITEQEHSVLIATLHKIKHNLNTKNMDFACD